jgi:hypothetical protein
MQRARYLVRPYSERGLAAVHSRVILACQDVLFIAALVRENFILVVNRSQKRIEQIDLATQQVHVIAENLKYPYAVSYDSVREVVYWSDYSTDTIHSVNLDQSDMKTLVSGVSKSCNLLYNCYTSTKFSSDAI